MLEPIMQIIGKMHWHTMTQQQEERSIDKSGRTFLTWPMNFATIQNMASPSHMQWVLLWAEIWATISDTFWYHSILANFCKATETPRSIWGSPAQLSQYTQKLIKHLIKWRRVLTLSICAFCCRMDHPFSSSYNFKPIDISQENNKCRKAHLKNKSRKPGHLPCEWGPIAVQNCVPMSSKSLHLLRLLRIVIKFCNGQLQ
jgi:hypothetical protein